MMKLMSDLIALSARSARGQSETGRARGRLESGAAKIARSAGGHDRNRPAAGIDRSIRRRGRPDEMGAEQAIAFRGRGDQGDPNPEPGNAERGDRESGCVARRKEGATPARRRALRRSRCSSQPSAAKSRRARVAEQAQSYETAETRNAAGSADEPEPPAWIPKNLAKGGRTNPRSRPFIRVWVDSATGARESKAVSSFLDSRPSKRSAMESLAMPTQRAIFSRRVQGNQRARLENEIRAQGRSASRDARNLRTPIAREEKGRLAGDVQG